MPMSRYEIRNEYSLADPELYRAADKDDPEALLEGVAMAGLVGVLRQLGDLAQFAAEIFHDLHEEVMATAARGHSLTIRVQQLEAEVPSIEKAFLSQTDHSSFFYNAGVDWRPNLRMDQNLVTQGDLPRLIMDSYEECRGPPRLFLLDKFDTAGAGACLKRYTDPSVFKVETSAMANADIQREKKIRKIKRKGLREVLPASHAKLHQLLAEEPIENGVSKPTHRAKLKRRPNGFPFDSKTRKSCMEKLLKTSSPEHKMLHEITETLPLRLSENHHNECDLDVLEPRSVSPARGSEGRKINPPSPEREDIMLSPFMNQTNDESTDIKMCEGTSYLDTVTNGITSTFDEEDVEKDITVYGESKMEGSLIGYQSDEVASEIDNYMDASSTMESEMDRDSELRAKNDFTSSYIKSKLLVSVENEEHLLSQLSDSQSTEELTISDEGNNFCRKEMSSFLSSDYPRTSAESPQSEKLSAEGLPSADIPEIATGNASSYHKTADEDFPVDGLPEPVVSNNTFPGKDALPNNQSDFEQLTSDLCHTNSIPVLPYYDSRRVVGKARLMRPKSDETASTSDDEEKKTNLIVDSPCSGSVSHSKSLSRDDSPGSSSEEHLVDSENVPCMSAVADIICPTSDSSAAIPAYLLHEDDFDREDLNQFGNMTSTLNIDNVLFQKRIDAEEVISSENPILGKLVNEVTKLPDNFASDSTDIAHNGDNITSKASEGEKQNDNLYKEGLNVVPDDPNPFSCVMDASIGKEFREEIISNENSTPGKLDNKVTELPDNFAFDSADRDQNGGNITSYVSEGERQNGHLYNEDTNVVSDAPNHVSCLIDSSTGKEFRETSLSNAETVNSEDHHFNSSTGNQISSETLILSGMENSPDLLGEDLDAYDTDFIPEEATTVNKIPELGTPKSCEVVGLWGTGLTDDVTPIDLVALKSSFSPENLEDPAGTSDTAEKDGINPDSGVIGLELTEIPSPADLKLVKEVHVLLGESDSKTDQSETAVMACSVPAVSDYTIWENVSLPAGLDKLVEEHIPCFENSGLGELENDKTSFSVGNRESELVEKDKNHLSGSNRELDLVEKVDEIEAATLDFHAGVCCSDNNDHRKSEVPQNVFNSCLDSGVEQCVDFVDTAQIHSPLEQSGLDTDQESFQKSGVENQLCDSNALHIDCVTEETTLQEKIELAHEQIDKESPDSSEISSELSSLLPITHQQMLDHDNDKGHNNFASAFPLVNFPSSISGLSGLRNYGTDVCAHPKEQLDFIFPPSNLFSEANQINLNESPPLPPLPPLQWRMEKFHHALSGTEVDKMEQKEVLPLEIFPGPSPGNVSSSLEQMGPSPVKIVPLPLLKEENVEQSSPSSPANSMHETIDLSPDVENEQEQQLVMPTQDSESSPGLEANSMHQTIDLPPKIENEQQWLVMPTQESKSFPTLKANSLHETIDLATKIENEQRQLVTPMQESESSPRLEANSMHETADLLPKIENEQGQLVIPTQDSEVKSPAEEDRVANGSQTAKLPRSCNPLIGSVATLDESKNKLRKVTERVRPQIQKLDERDSLLEQIRAKSFNLKPPVVSRPSTQRPNTNLKVAAILEKANAIRQALAGSDEDDEDNWSDS